MEKYQFNTNKGEKANIIQFDVIHIEQNKFKYDLNIEAKENTIYFAINDNNQLPPSNFKRAMSFKEIKELNVQFHALNTFGDFYIYLKSLSNNNKLNIKKSSDKISILFNVEVLLKKQSIVIDLFPEKIYLELIIKKILKELKNIKNENKRKDNDINKLINENLELKKEINILKNKDIEKDNEINSLRNDINNLKSYNREKGFGALNNYKIELKREFGILNNDKNELKEEIDFLKNQNQEIIKNFEEINIEIDNLKQMNFDKSVIMQESEKDIIFPEIEKKIDKRIKKAIKLYQATIDGGDTINFHNTCDNIPNTLVLVISEGLRRFGGFTPIPWNSKGGFKLDPEMKTFVFSLDKKKIYYLKNKECIAVWHDNKSGPCFGWGFDIGIEGDPIKEKKLYTNQSSFDYKKGNHSLSEYENPLKLKALDYEVFQIIFY